jgi:hypothetical protein
MSSKAWLKLFLSTLTIVTTFEIKSAYSQSQETDRTIYIAKNTQKNTEVKVRQILQGFINNFKARDLESYMKPIAKNCKLELSIKSEAGESNLGTLNREQFQAVIQQSLSNVDSYKGSMNNLKIKISSDGKSATANYTLLEEIETSNGYIISTTSSESTKFETIDGQILMTYRKSVGRFN